jgi:hypothetical protein
MRRAVAGAGAAGTGRRRVRAEPGPCWVGSEDDAAAAEEGVGGEGAYDWAEARGEAGGEEGPPGPVRRVIGPKRRPLPARPGPARPGPVRRAGSDARGQGGEWLRFCRPI